MSKRDKGKKDYTVVIEATEVGDPTGYFAFRIINDNVDDLTLDIRFDNPDDNAPGEWKSYYFSDITQGALAVVCQAFFYPGSASSVVVDIKFSTPGGDKFNLAEQGGINNEYETSFEGNGVLTFTNNDVPVVVPPYKELIPGELVFIQCLEEGIANKVFLCGDAVSGQVSLKKVYTNKTPGLTWIVREADNHQYYLELYNQAGNYLQANSVTGNLSTQNNHTLWELEYGNPSGECNYYRMKCIDNVGMKIYLKGHIEIGEVNLIENPEEGRAMLWYFHRIRD